MVPAVQLQVLNGASHGDTISLLCYQAGLSICIQPDTGSKVFFQAQKCLLSMIGARYEKAFGREMRILDSQRKQRLGKARQGKDENERITNTEFAS
jgi:hypothetical protein